jgi:hypothetical protein
MSNENQREVDITRDGEDKTYYVVKPKHAQNIEAQIEYNKALRSAIDSGAFLRKELYKKLEEDGTWTKKMEEEQKKILKDIGKLEEKIRNGGLTLTELKNTGIEIKKLRTELRILIAKKNEEDQLTAESQAENSRFYSYISTCILDENKNRAFKSIEDYEEKSEEDWAVKCVEELAELLYGLEKDYENNYVENRFLRKYKIINEENRFIRDGKLVDKDGRLIDDEGYYIDEDGNRINKEGRRIDENGDYLDAAPMLDDDGNPIILDDESEEEEKDDEENNEESENSSEEKPKKRGRPKKTE